MRVRHAVKYPSNPELGEIPVAVEWPIELPSQNALRVAEGGSTSVGRPLTHVFMTCGCADFFDDSLKVPETQRLR